MPAGLPVIEVAHWSALAPLVFLLLFRREAPVRYWLVALGFSVSVFADFGALLLDHSPVLYYVFPVLQFGLFAWALGAPWVLAVLTVIAGAQIVGTDLAGPDRILSLVGSAAVLALAWRSDTPLIPSLVAYCGLGTAFYLLMTVDIWANRFMVWWYGYQGSRLLAFGLFGWLAWKETGHA